MFWFPFYFKGGSPTCWGDSAIGVFFVEHPKGWGQDMVINKPGFERKNFGKKRRGRFGARLTSTFVFWWRPLSGFLLGFFVI